LPRSTGLAAVRSPFDRPQSEAVDADSSKVDPAGHPQLVQQHHLELVEHAGLGPLVERRQQVVALPQPSSLAGSRLQGVEVRAMKISAAIQARSGTVRGAPPRAWEGGGGNRGWMRCHSWSGSSVEAAPTTLTLTVERDLSNGVPHSGSRWFHGRYAFGSSAAPLRAVVRTRAAHDARMGRCASCRIWIGDDPNTVTNLRFRATFEN
jgi:hypothetical protein